MIAKIEMPIIKEPVQEGGAREQGRAVIQCCQRLEHKGVRGRGGLDMASQCEVKGVDDHCYGMTGPLSIFLVT